MKTDVSTLQQGVIWGEYQVAIDISLEKADELRKALKIVQDYEKIALEAFKSKFKYNPTKTSDWCEIGYSVKNDKVLVIIRDGMAG